MNKTIFVTVAIINFLDISQH